MKQYLDEHNNFVYIPEKQIGTGVKPAPKPQADGTKGVARFDSREMLEIHVKNMNGKQLAAFLKTHHMDHLNVEDFKGKLKELKKQIVEEYALSVPAKAEGGEEVARNKDGFGKSNPDDVDEL